MITLGRIAIAALGATAAVLTGCAAGPSMTWEKQLDALRMAGERGADAHYVLLTKSEPTNQQVCSNNYDLFLDLPAEYSSGSSSVAWQRLHRQYFVDSCTSGQPRQPHTRPTNPPAPSPAPMVRPIP